MIGRTNAQISGASRVAGGEVIVSHSVGTGGMTDHGVVTLQDGGYRLLEVKQSGTLTFDEGQVERGIVADICVVGGGSGGASLNNNGTWQLGGGNGGVMYNFYNNVIKSSLTAVIGAGGLGGTGGSGEGSFGSAGGRGGLSNIAKTAFTNSIPFQVPDTSNSANSNTYTQQCGTGGGKSYAGGGAGTPDGLPKYPFGDSSHFNIHCGGGGGGAFSRYNQSDYRNGGDGGTNGSVGSNYSSNQGSYPVTGGAAGDWSAGEGGNASFDSSTAGSDANYYGGGGGGGGGRYWSSYFASSRAGNGYQGVIWIRIPA